ncbi:MAG TPA: LuxR C-terminal-related transcriptional regulator, partial [Roseiflexaceae bacterium]|nr:LuxR C-terminal-related transcriptional regulator [Roseiflexaceae bacterium]
LDGALALLDEADQLYMSDFSPNVRPIAALKTRVWLAQGRLGEALDWARAQGLSAHDDLSYGREFEHITLARILLTQYKSERADRFMREAIGLLNRLLEAAEAGARMDSVIEILVVQALVHQAQGNIPAALVPLSRALTLAAPEGYVRMFVDEGPPMKLLIADCRLQIARRANGESNLHTGKLLAYIDTLLAAFSGSGAQAGNERTTKDQSEIYNLQSAMVEPLSERELDVLRLLRTELSGPEIARQLMVSLNTLRTHTKNIYDKLGVNNRRAAIHRAEELKLL